MENVLIAGANGTTGKKITSLLKASTDFNPVAMVRKESQMKQFEDEQIDVVLGDLEKDVSHAVQNIDKVVFAAGSGGKNVVGVDQDGAKKLIDASKKVGLKKFVMLSSMGAGEPKKVANLRKYLEAKHNADEYLKDSDLNYVIVRPGTLTNEDGTGKVRLDKKLETSGSISRDDVAQTLVDVLHIDAVNKKTFEILEGDTPIRQAAEAIG
ncbi:SDR family oxidoreductase [uncultured Kriegella sp.]|uniref:SDR family oxidoreductase n=1 Tax=uncultured Kriegella sp. TaxID=1798910 RepID=UPI0030D75EE1|tara:strand:+ start:394638 stop:395267 length:630 start_codon:yes stop_codon:yes gene_type:complete